MRYRKSAKEIIRLQKEQNEKEPFLVQMPVAVLRYLRTGRKMTDKEVKEYITVATVWRLQSEIDGECDETVKGIEDKIASYGLDKIFSIFEE